MTRWKASAIHFSISLLIGLTAFCLLYFVYYPQPYFEPAGAGKLVLILLGVDVILGPLLTLVVFKSGKKSLKFDLSIIAVVQMAALIYGLHVMWVARPVFVVAAAERFVIVYANQISDKNYESAKIFNSVPLFGPKLVGARVPVDSSERTALLESALRGCDIECYPKYFVPYDAEFAKEFVGFSLSSNKLKGVTGPRFWFVPLRGRQNDFALELRADGEPLQAHNVNPW